jgi:hypothetical protein
MVIWLREQGAPDADVLEEARRLVRWHYYEWIMIMIHEFLPLSVGEEVVADVLENGRRFYQLAKSRRYRWSSRTRRTGSGIARSRRSIA